MKRTMDKKYKYVYYLLVINVVISMGTLCSAEGDDIDKKYGTFEKQKLARSSQQQKKPVFVKPNLKSNNFLSEKSKGVSSKKEQATVLETAVLESVVEPVVDPAADPSVEPVTEPENSETDRICLSIAEDSVPDFLTKFGLITHLIDDVNNFRAQVKTSRSRQLDRASKAQSDEDLWWPRQNKKKKLSKNKLSKYADRQFISAKAQGMGQGSESSVRSSDSFKHNYLYSRLRQSKNQETVPTCFGYEYLTALEAYNQETDAPDIETLQGSLSDMLSMKLSSQLTDILETCSEGKTETSESANIRAVCPIVEVKRPGLKSSSPGDNFEQTSEMRSACEESCFTDNDCGSSGERCCPNDCGGHTCHSPIKWSSQKQKVIQSQCSKADSFMQCLYDQLKEKVCAPEKLTKS